MSWQRFGNCWTIWKEAPGEYVIGNIEISTRASDRLGLIALALAGCAGRSGVRPAPICAEAPLGKRALPSWLSQPWTSAGNPGAAVAQRADASSRARS